MGRKGVRVRKTVWDRGFKMRFRVRKGSVAYESQKVGDGAKGSGGTDGFRAEKGWRGTKGVGGEGVGDSKEGVKALQGS